MKAHDRIILEKVCKYAEQTVKFAGGLNFDKFSADDKTVSACVFSLSQVGEMVNKFSEEFFRTNVSIPWHKIKGLRNRIVHDYDGIRLNIIWDVINDYLPDLIKEIKELLKK